eukprot:5641084-Amphidinium_carterae.1
MVTTVRPPEPGTKGSSSPSRVTVKQSSPIKETRNSHTFVNYRRPALKSWGWELNNPISEVVSDPEL